MRTASQLVQLASVLFEQGGRFVELPPAASLKRDLGLLQEFPAFSRVKKPRTITMSQAILLSRGTSSHDVGKRRVCRSQE